MLSLFEMFASGIIIGLTLGLSPSPIMTLSISNTIKYGPKEGIKIAFVPLITDLPIALISIIIISRLPNKEQYLGGIFIIGALFIARLGWKGVMTKELQICSNMKKTGSFRQGIITNFLNPNVYVFWFTLGSVAVVNSWTESPESSILYLIGFYTMLIGSRVVLTFIIAKSKVFKNPKAYIITIKTLGIVLIGFSLYYGYQGINSLL